MKDDGVVDGIKQAEGVLAETLQMIPHSEANLQKNLGELEVLVKTAVEGSNGDGDVLDADNEWVIAANAILAEHGMAGGKKDGGAAGDDGADEPATSVDDLAEGEAF